MSKKIRIHTQEEFEKMRVSGMLAANTLKFIKQYIKPGITTNQINQLCHDFIIKNDGYPAPLNYKGFPKSVCTSINDIVCHGIPNDTALQEGDILNVDVTTIVNDFHGDTSNMFLVTDKNENEINSLYQDRIKLIDITKKALEIGISVAKPGNRFGEIGFAIQNFVESQGFSVVEDFCGHGIGKYFHAAPEVLHFGEKHWGAVIEPGMFFTIEPMINAGSKEVYISRNDGWTVRTKDGSLSAQFEHTIGITQTGNEIFTL
jgi:methionyl aminopeptidase